MLFVEKPLALSGSANDVYVEVEEVIGEERNPKGKNVEIENLNVFYIYTEDTESRDVCG